jgi:hypothetical protein
VITVTLGDLTQRDDLPVLSNELEAAAMPSPFLDGEVTARVLIKTAVDQGTAVGIEVARCIVVKLFAEQDSEIMDLIASGCSKPLFIYSSS